MEHLIFRSQSQSRNHGTSEGVIMICEIRVKVNFQGMGIPRFTFHVGALIGIRASACSATGQMISGTGPQAARNRGNQGNYRDRDEKARPWQSL